MLWLVLLSVIMFAASYGLGSIPLYLSLPERTIARLSIASTGVLLASALAIIIPEGCEAIYSSTGTGIGQGTAEESHGSAEKFVGLAIVLGFILMYLIEQFTVHLHTSGSTVSYVAVDSLHELQEHRIESGATGSSDHKLSERSAWSSTFGLCIHSLADGIALGSSAHADTSLNILVFFAILLHKGPASFGLVTILLHKGLTRRLTKLHLAAFSIAAPIGALTTYLAMAWFGIAYDPDHASAGTGLLLLFSGGTFLFVAISHAPRDRLDASSILCMLGGMAVPVLVSILVNHDH